MVMVSTTRHLASSGAAVGPDGPSAAVAQAVAALGARDAALILLFGTPAGGADEAVTQASDAARGVPVAGMTSRSVVTPDGPVEGGWTALALDSSLQVGMGVAEEASRHPHEAGRAAAAEAFAALDLLAGYPLLLLFVDAESGDQSEIIAGAYEVTGGRVPMAGGGADGRAAAEFAGAAAYRDSVVAVGLVSPQPIGVGVAHGCFPRGVPSLVTRSEGRTILELDGRPADVVYLEKLGLAGANVSDADFEALAVLHPLAQPALSGGVRLRHVLRRAPAGGLECATPVPTNAAVGIGQETPVSILESTREAVDDALAPLDGPPRAALVFDCAARRRALGPALASEVHALASSFPERPPLVGLYTRGEIGRIRGAKGDLNHALVVVVFG